MITLHLHQWPIDDWVKGGMTTIDDTAKGGVTQF